MIDADIVIRIGKRRVIVDACVSREVAGSLRNNGLIVRHVVDINSKLKDLEIAALMYPDEVLITKDCGFYRLLGKEKAILLSPTSDRMTRGKSVVKKDRRVRMRRKLPSHIRMALREKLAEETRMGTLYTKILWCIMWLVLPIAS
jgi:hypothetical protein